MLETSARLLRLLATLQTRRFWTGNDLAGHLEVTPRTLRRDVDRLRSLGYAVEATSGHGGGYHLGTGTAMPPLLLDDEESVAVAVALRSATDTVAGLGETAIRVLVKVEQLLPARLRRRVGALQAMTVSVNRYPQTAVDPDRLATLAAACRDSTALHFPYRRREGSTAVRAVEPLRLAHAGGGRWYLVAWDVEREDWRTFRVDRIEGAIGLGARFVPRQPPGDLEAYVAESLAHAPFAHQARVKLRGSLEELSQRIPVWCGVLERLDDESCVLRAGAESLDGLVCQLVLCGSDFELLDPPELAPQLRAAADRLLRAAGPAPAATKGTRRERRARPGL
ncbi:helix-turn-helix transcriptional regulator [Vulgatibacter sp.]|uniref:helix-turn-helix transcriptional regulator n=1 Tax=Vulgatibacter sp. TaxID=1971226 RepID=UPI00356A9C1A